MPFHFHDHNNALEAMQAWIIARLYSCIPFTIDQVKQWWSFTFNTMCQKNTIPNRMKYFFVCRGLTARISTNSAMEVSMNNRVISINPISFI